jgi:hypothetical protein
MPMLFEEAIPLIERRLWAEGFDYLMGGSWVRAVMEEHYDGKNTDHFGEAGKIVTNFIKENLVEAPTSLAFRMAIMAYTQGYLFRDLVYMERFPKNTQDYNVHKEHSKLTFANALIQWTLLCKQLNLDWDEMLRLGEEHLAERYRDFQEDGWVGVK